MKQIFLLAFVLISSVSFAQNSKLNTASTAYESGDYKVAYDAIMAATEHKKTKDNPTTWIMLAKIYDGTQMSGVGSLLGIDVPENGIEDALLQAKELGASNEQIAEAAQSLIDRQHNAGVIAYSQENDYQKAIDAFTRKHELITAYQPENEIEILDYVIIGSSYYNLEDFENMVPYYEKAIAANYDEPGVYHSLLNFYNENEDTDNYLRVVKIAQNVYPDEPNWQYLEIDQYIKNGTIDSKEKELLATAEKNPNNSSIMLILASIYEAQSNYAKQVEWANKAYQLKPNDFSSIFNLGVGYFNQAVEINRELNYMQSATTPEYKEAKRKRDELADKAIHLFEQAYSIEPTNPNLLEGFIQYHLMYGNTDKVAKYESELQ